MLEHLHQIIAPILAVLAAVGLVFAKRSAAQPASPGQPAPSDPGQPKAASDGLTVNAAMELICHEAIVCEAYKDSKGIWTWGIGVTDASGHKVERYIDNPQTVQRCLEVFIWLLRAKYLPAVLKAFAGYPLTEAQLAAALSFHYNTGAIRTASWVKLWKAGEIAKARASFLSWNKPKEVIGRRENECTLFFDGKWSNDGLATVLPVNKPSYQPSFKRAYKVNVSGPLKDLLG